MKTKKEKEIYSISQTIDMMVNIYEGMLLEIRDIYNELENSYRLEKITDDKGKSCFKNQLRYLNTRKELTEQEQREYFNKIVNRRTGNIIREAYSNILNDGEVASLNELWQKWFEKIGVFLKNIEIKEKELGFNIYDELSENVIMKFNQLKRSYEKSKEN